MNNRACARIDLSALQHNYRVVRRLVGRDRHIMVMIKADAYGHGLLQVARALSEADALGVATLDEAIRLRDANITAPIVVTTGFITSEELDLFFHYQLTPVVHHPLQIELLEKSKCAQSIAVWLKVDTGMHRLGFSADAFEGAFQQLFAIPNVQKPIQLMTHLADPDNADRTFTESQLQLFSTLTKAYPGEKSVGNSAGILAYQDALGDVVRPGIMLYGVSPFADRVGSAFGLKPVMQLSAQLIAVKNIKKGDKVGYGCTWEAQKALPLGVVGIGYGDGYPRHIQNGTPVLVNGVLCPVVGRVSMDMITIDLSQQTNVSIGDEVILWGRDLPIETIAASAGTIAYELLCQLTQRIAFDYETA